MITLLGMAGFKGYLIFTQSYCHLLPRTPHYSRFTRVVRNAQGLIAELAMNLAIILKTTALSSTLKLCPWPIGGRVHGRVMADVQVGKGPLGGFAGSKMAAAIDSRALFTRWALLPGNVQEQDTEGLVAGLSGCLGDSGFRWLAGVLTPAHHLRGGQRVETGWQPWMYRARNWIEWRFSVMVRSFGPQQLEAKQYWSLVSRVNLMILTSNLVHSHALLKLAGVKVRSGKQKH